METLQFQVNRALSIRQDKETGAISFGLTANSPFEIASPPVYLPMMLTTLSYPHSISDLLELVTAAFSTAEPLEIRETFFDLLRLGVVSASSTPGRYDRHQLYFDFFDVNRQHYDSLRKCTVGLIGCGGIGSTCALLLGAAGVGELVISDGDLLEESNLTRTILFEESDIGILKVESARDRLLARNSELKINVVPHKFSGRDFLRENFSHCDAWILSADIPSDVHIWADDVAIELGIPYINAGYVETIGVAGPFVIPGKSPCYKCTTHGNESSLDYEELNESLQAPSYGPLNSLVSSVAVNEVLRYLLGLDIHTQGRQVTIDSGTYRVVCSEIIPVKDCRCGVSNYYDKFSGIAENYTESRDLNSMNAQVLDSLVVELVCDGSELRILDVGCGIGTLSLVFAQNGHNVTAVDASPTMLNEFRRRMDLDRNIAAKINLLQGDAATVEWGSDFDRVLLNLIIDHIKEPSSLLNRVRQCLSPNGEVIVIVPHPIKDAGSWDKESTKGEWSYKHLTITDYFKEGLIEKYREDDKGNTVIERITSYRRTISTYIQMMIDAGLSIEQVLEPKPVEESESYSANNIKASRIPYFLVLRCSVRRV